MRLAASTVQGVERPAATGCFAAGAVCAAFGPGLGTGLVATGCFAVGADCTVCVAFGTGLGMGLAAGWAATEGVGALFATGRGVAGVLFPADGLVPGFVMVIRPGVVSRPPNVGRGDEEKYSDQ